MARRQIKCIRQIIWRDRHERITHVGGDWGYNNARVVITEDEAMRDINTNTHSYFVRDARGDEAEVIVVRHHPKNYLRTDPDKTTADNLLSLPECS